ncbi:hypothetical protein DFH08DRAFT_755182, partial [Mycena albidolilacea]
MNNPPPDSAESTIPRNLESPPLGSAMFSDSQGFTVSGGTFTNITHHHAASVPSDRSPVSTRMIPLEDIDLRHEIRVDEDTGVVERVAVRRVYSARVEGRKSKFTVAIYQGDGAKEEWRRNIAKYTAIRHPNIIQIYGAASSCGIHATLFHDDLVPFQQYVDTYRYSHFATAYFYACRCLDFSAASYHVHYTSQLSLIWGNYTAWIRRSSGQLCAELVPPCTPQPELYYPGETRFHRISSASDTDLVVIESLTMYDYHNICFTNLSQFQTISISASMTVKPGTIVSRSPGHPLEDPVEIAYAPNMETFFYSRQTSDGMRGVAMEDGWTQFKSDDVFNGMIKLWIWFPPDCGQWLSQANHIFRHLRIQSNFEDYVFVHGMYFMLEVPGTREEPPAGFLFLCPLEDFKTSPSSFQWPDSPAFWSLDPSGDDQLALEEATRLGFPAFRCITKLRGKSWEASVYEGLRKFHLAKGFDPDTQDLARHLGRPLYQSVSEVNEAEEDWDADDDLNYTQTSIDSNAETSEQDDWDVDDESNYPQTSDNSDAEAYSEEDDNKSGSADCSFHHAPRNSNRVNHDHPALTARQSTTGQGDCEMRTLHDETPIVSGTFTFLMNAQLALICSSGYPG